MLHSYSVHPYTLSIVISPCASCVPTGHIAVFELTRSNRAFVSFTGLIPHLRKSIIMSKADETYNLITRNLQEVLGGEIIKDLLVQGKTVKCYWGAFFVWSET
jgi:hypothetical protein